MTERLSWRRAVERSRELGSARITLLKHAGATQHHWHDEVHNLHGVTQDRLAAWLDRSPLTVSRHLARAEQLGYVRLHENARHGIQQTYHYLLPGEAPICDRCEARWLGRGGDSDPALDPTSDPSLTHHRVSATDPSTGDPPSKPKDSLVALDSPAVGGTTVHGESAADLDPAPGSSRSQRLSPDHSATANPAVDLNSETGSGPSATRDRAREAPDCRVCDPDDAAAAAESVDLAAAQLDDPDQWADAGLAGDDGEVVA